jgi:putative flippase GtrA
MHSYRVGSSGFGVYSWSLFLLVAWVKHIRGVLGAFTAGIIAIMPRGFHWQNSTTFRNSVY